MHFTYPALFLAPKHRGPSGPSLRRARAAGSLLLTERAAVARREALPRSARPPDPPPPKTKKKKAKGVLHVFVYIHIEL